MKPDIKIDHTASGFDAFGIDKERAAVIDIFLRALVNEAYVEHYKRSQIIERIIEFSNSYVEAIVIYGFVESFRNGAAAVSVPPGLQELLKKILSPGMFVDGNGNLN